MTKLLRVGIIGLGKRWERRYRPALLELKDFFEVRALCDGVVQRAINEAHPLGCDAVAGPTQMLESKEVDAVLLLDPQWYRLWPLEAACRYGVPVFSCATPEIEEDRSDHLENLVRDSKLPVMVEMPIRHAPVMTRLRELLQSRLGQARAVLGEIVAPARQIPEAKAASLRSLLGARGSHLLDACAALLGGAPLAVQAFGALQADLAAVHLEFSEGRAAQLTRWQSVGARPRVRLRVLAERGSAVLNMPYRLHWSDTEGQHAQVFRRQGSIARHLLLQFHQAIASGQVPRPSWADACRIVDWLRAALQSREQGRRIALAESPDRTRSLVETGEPAS